MTTGGRCLLDTNVISDEGKDIQHPAVARWVAGTDPARIWMSVVVLGEARRWVEGKPEGRKKTVLRTKMEKWENWPAERVLPVTLEVALRWGVISVRNPTLQAADGLVAATAMVHNMVLATRNVKDFRNIPGLSILNPWADE